MHYVSFSASRGFLMFCELVENILGSEVQIHLPSILHRDDETFRDLCDRPRLQKISHEMGDFWA